jgi:hypothetical protein
VLNPLNKLLKCLETPNKLIEKRSDKLLDYEFAKSNIEKLNDRHIVRQHLSNLVEAEQNFDALNGQLIEDLPRLTHSCSFVFGKCLRVYASIMKSINYRVFSDLTRIVTNVIEI